MQEGLNTYDSRPEFQYAYRINDGVNPVQESSGATVLANTLSGLGIDEFFSRTDVPAATTSHFFAGALGSALALADSTGSIQTEYTYEPFGKTTMTGVSNTNPFQYTGRENDGTGLYYYRGRYYHPILQRFTSEDSHPGFNGLPQSLNKYSYVMNDPTNYIDPLGLSRKDPQPPGCPPTGCPPPMCPPAGCMPPECPLGYANCLGGVRPQSGGGGPEPQPPVTPPDNCPGCYTWQGKVYDENGDPVKVDPGPQRIWGDATRMIIRQFFNRGAGSNPEY